MRGFSPGSLTVMAARIHHGQSSKLFVHRVVVTDEQVGTSNMLAVTNWSEKETCHDGSCEGDSVNTSLFITSTVYSAVTGWFHSEKCDSVRYCFTTDLGQTSTVTRVPSKLIGPMHFKRTSMNCSICTTRWT